MKSKVLSLVMSIVVGSVLVGCGEPEPQYNVTQQSSETVISSSEEVEEVFNIFEDYTEIDSEMIFNDVNAVIEMAPEFDYEIKYSVVCVDVARDISSPDRRFEYTLALYDESRENLLYNVEFQTAPMRGETEDAAMSFFAVAEGTSIWDGIFETAVPLMPGTQRIVVDLLNARDTGILPDGYRNECAVVDYGKDGDLYVAFLDKCNWESTTFNRLNVYDIFDTSNWKDFDESSGELEKYLHLTTDLLRTRTRYDWDNREPEYVIDTKYDINLSADVHLSSDRSIENNYVKTEVSADGQFSIVRIYRPYKTTNRWTNTVTVYNEEMYTILRTKCNPKVYTFVKEY